MKFRLPFYPDVPSILNADIEKMFESVRVIIGDKEIIGEIKAIIAPLAGYMYSGQSAAIAYSFVRGANSYKRRDKGRNILRTFTADKIANC